MIISRSFLNNLIPFPFPQWIISALNMVCNSLIVIIGLPFYIKKARAQKVINI